MSNCVVSSCDEKVIVTVTEDICAQGIKLGGEADISFVKQNILPYYISKKWLTKDPPKGQKSLYGTIATIPFSFYLLFQAGKRRAAKLSSSATILRTTTVTQIIVKKREIVSKPWHPA